MWWCFCACHWSVLAPSYAALADELKLTASEIHAGVERAMAAQLLRKDAAGKPTVLLESLRCLFSMGCVTVFRPLGARRRAVHPQATPRPHCCRKSCSRTRPPVWPYKAGSVRGTAFYPLYPTVPEAAARNQSFYELLALLDAVRGGSPRERALALTELDKRWADQGT